MTLATRRLQFCAGHRVFRHESKCAHMHGHNYVLEFSAESRGLLGGLDSIGRVIDFSVMKERLGQWVEENWDHGFIYCKDDDQMSGLFASPFGNGMKTFELPLNPTAELMASYLLWEVCPKLFADTDVEVVRIVLHETENCSVEVRK